MTSTTLLFDLDGTLTDNYAGIAASIEVGQQRMDFRHLEYAADAD